MGPSIILHCRRINNHEETNLTKRSGVALKLCFVSRELVVPVFPSAQTGFPVVCPRPCLMGGTRASSLCTASLEALAWAAARLMEQLRAGTGREEVSSKAWPFLTHHFGTAPSSMTLLCADTGRIFTMSPSSRQELASLPCRPCCRLGGTPRGVEVGGDPICSQSWLLQHGPWCEAGELLPGMLRFS